MTKSKQLGELIGPTIIAMTLSETLNAHIWIANTAAGVSLNGTLLFVAGLAIIRAHNVWVRQWPVMVTLTGWCAMALGLFRMFAPEIQLKNTGNTTLITAEAMIVLTVGIFITIKAYAHNQSEKI